MERIEPVNTYREWKEMSDDTQWLEYRRVVTVARRLQRKADTPWSSIAKVALGGIVLALSVAGAPVVWGAIRLAWSKPWG